MLLFILLFILSQWTRPRPFSLPLLCRVIELAADADDLVAATTTATSAVDLSYNRHPFCGELTINHSVSLVCYEVGRSCSHESNCKLLQDLLLASSAVKLCPYVGSRLQSLGE